MLYGQGVDVVSAPVQIQYDVDDAAQTSVAVNSYMPTKVYKLCVSYNSTALTVADILATLAESNTKTSCDCTMNNNKPCRSELKGDDSCSALSDRVVH